MRILYATDHISYLVGEKVYLSSRIYVILKRYANIFEEIILYSKFQKCIEAPNDAVNADFIVGYLPVNGYLKTLLLKDEGLKEKISQCNLVVGRVPGFSANKALDYARKLGVPTFTEAMGCAWDAFWNHGIAGKMIAPYMFFKMKHEIWCADYVSYVTSRFLQNRYPCRVDYLAASNVFIPSPTDDILRNRLNLIDSVSNYEFKLMTTAAVNVKFKGQQFVIKGIPKLNQLGIKVRYYIVGDGDQRYLRGIAKKYEVENQVEFTGKLTRPEVIGLLDAVDVYLQPSLQEGLPRAMVEALSRGCPAIGAKTAGIPELIQSEMIVKRRSSSDIVKKISAFIALDSEYKKKIARENFEKSKDYVSSKLDERRNEYYRKVKSDVQSIGERG